MENENLLKYKGWKCNTLAINTIEYEFQSYKVILCENEFFNKEIYLHKTIRCLVHKDIIIDLKLN